jgi:predicted peroxiredoxin
MAGVSRNLGVTDMARLQYVVTHGPDDPTKACMPFHLAVNGAIAAGIEAEISLTGDAALLIQDRTIEQLVPLGFPPLKDLIRSAIEHKVPIHV